MAVCQLPNKHCLSLKHNIKVLAPFLTDLFNKSLSTAWYLITAEVLQTHFKLPKLLERLVAK